MQFMWVTNIIHHSSSTSVWQKQQLQGLWGNTGQATGLWKTVSTEKKNAFKLLK